MIEGNPLPPNTGGTEEPTPAHLPTLPKREGNDFARTLGLDWTTPAVPSLPLIGEEKVEEDSAAKPTMVGTKATKPKLQVANGYSANFDQLAQLLHAVNQDSRQKIPIAELAESVGLATRQMEQLTSIAVALGLILPRTMVLTTVGALIGAHDQFFDDMGSLWFLHYVIGSNPQLLIWNRFVNVFLPAKPNFSTDELRCSFDDLKLTHSEYSARAHVNKEINTILDAYTNQQFAKLAYLRQTDEGYSLGYRQPVPLLVLAASISRFRDRHHAGNTAVSVRDLLTADNSPGVVFQMHEDTLRAGLEQLKHGHGFSLEARADLDQLRFAEDIPDHVFMERYYASR